MGSTNYKARGKVWTQLSAKGQPDSVTGTSAGAEVCEVQVSQKVQQDECEIQRDSGFSFDLNTMEERREERKVFPSLLSLELPYKAQQAAESQMLHAELYWH